MQKDPVNIGAKVRLADRVVGEGDEQQTIPGRGSDRIGEVKKISRGLSSDGKREVQNCHVAFPEVKTKNRKLKACIEVHEGDALEVVG
jgi:hypothetical protein